MGINQAGSTRLLLATPGAGTMSVMTLPCAAETSGEILLLFKNNDHNYKHHLLCA